MNIENRINQIESSEVTKENIKEALKSKYFSVYCDDNINEYLKSNDTEKMDDIKKYVDDTLESEWIAEGQKAKVYLFSDEEQYQEFLNKNFSDTPKGKATFDKKTNSVIACTSTDFDKYRDFFKANLTDEEIKSLIRGVIFSEIGHEFAHLHSPFNGVGNNNGSENKWEQEMVCVYIENKIRSKFDEVYIKNIKLIAKESLKTIQIDNKILSWEEGSDKWTNIAFPERFVYPWLEEKYGLEKLQYLWMVMFKDKKKMAEAVKEVYNEDIKVLENKFQVEMLEE